MTAQALHVYEILKKTLPEEDAMTVVEYLEDATEAKIVRQVENKIEHLASKADLSEVKADLIKWMFIFIVGQTAVLAALAAGIVKLLH
ncbi:hypothetical protein [Mucilaginibacter lappiensis]|uniref:Peptidyl-tRNA hydrolase n=1 Tax=Mucilaginibacter lappiensis TaxID=354630 RepID=A0A841JMJ9_9SPHI|nr:hypothetical protein [Mucilaginibacter lappiensis]MBB6131492.1 peptidyl-tRNA hydrolase [Mucilaginibacter lappiensis]